MVVFLGKNWTLSKNCVRSLAEPKLPEKSRLYGRKQTRALSEVKQKTFDLTLTQLQPDPSFIKGQSRLNMADLFGNNYRPSNATWMEIGFGSGEHLIGLMKQHPDIFMIGAEPFINGMANFFQHLADEKMPLSHIRVWMDDALLLARRLPDACLDRLYVLNPDPWPKKRHHKRRIINHDNLSVFARILKSGGQLIMATDVDELAGWMITQASLHPAFTWTAEKADDWRMMPEDWISTRYEIKGKTKGRRQTYLILNRN